ncbi:MAG: glutaminyl-peptide cyclotransferase [Syntrophales bacterium]
MAEARRENRKPFIVESVGRLILLCLALFAVVFPVHGGADGKPLTGTAPRYGYRVIRSHPHDRQAFTQGLIYSDGFLYEGTGLHGSSSLRKVELASGRVLKEIRLTPFYFGEGITAFGDRIVQVTWLSRVGFVYDKKTFRLLRKFTYPHEGWGITHDGKRLIMSDGTAMLHLLDPTDFHETAAISVFDERGPVAGLNELEYVRGAIYANIWPTNLIVVIDPGTGRVTARIDLKGLLDARDAPGTDVLNGIAYDAGGDRLFVTGKLWPKVFEIKIIKGRR